MQNLGITASTLTFDPFTEESIQNPYPFQQALREAGAVVWLEPYGVYATGWHHIADTVLQDWRRFTSRHGAGLTDDRTSGTQLTVVGQPVRALAHEQHPLIEVDPPAHKVTRSIIETVITAKVLHDVAEISAQQARALIDKLSGQDEIDLVEEFLVPIILSVWPDVMGIREDGRQALISLGELALNSLGPKNDNFQRSAMDMQPFGAWLKDTFTPSMLRADRAGAALGLTCTAADLSPSVTQDLIKSMVVAAINTTLSAAANTLYAAVLYPELWQALHLQKMDTRRFFDEAIRMEAPIQMSYRTVTEDTQLQGIGLQAGARIMVHLGACSRDERVFDEAHIFNPARSLRRHLGFGLGIHHCVGRALAKKQVCAIVQTLAHHIAHLEVVQPIQFIRNNTLRRVQNLVIRRR